MQFNLLLAFHVLLHLRRNVLSTCLSIVAKATLICTSHQKPCLSSFLRRAPPPSAISFDNYLWGLLFFTQFSDADQSYRSDCETDDGISVANYNEYLNGSSSQQQPTSRRKNRSPLTMRQGSQLSNEINNRRMQQYNSSQERLRNGELRNLDALVLV